METVVERNGFVLEPVPRPGLLSSAEAGHLGLLRLYEDWPACTHTPQSHPPGFVHGLRSFFVLLLWVRDGRR